MKLAVLIDIAQNGLPFTRSHRLPTFPSPLRAAVRRLSLAAATLLAGSIVIFVLLDVLPGSAAGALLGTAARPDTLIVLGHELGLDEPAPVRYAHWVCGAFTGDLGQSATYGVPVSGLIAERLAVTVPLTTLAMMLALIFGPTLGAAAAASRARWPDRVVTALTQVGMAIPEFWSGLLLILVFSTGLHWASAGGFPGWGAPVTAVRALVLPAIALALPQAAALARVTRASVLDVLEQDYIRTAWAKGGGRLRVVWRHALPNALAPVLTLLGLQLSFLFAGAVLVETVFNLPGLGRLAAQALAQRDLVVMRSVAMLLVVLVIGANTLVDLAQAWADPRLRGI